MTAAPNWVIGSGGLLGSAVVRALQRTGQQVFRAERIGWGTEAVDADLARNLERFARSAGDDWRIFWCAGAAVTGSSRDHLEGEVEVFRAFVSRIRDHLGDRAGGALFLASSVGAVYGGASEPPFTEETPAQPLGYYGRAKLDMEAAARAWSDSTGQALAIGRISNLYGPGQRLDKGQGLISRLCLAAVTRTPLSVFVPLDTRRDYIYVDDCAELVISFAERSAMLGGATTKILAAGQAASVGSLIGDLRRITTSAPPIVMSASAQSALQAPDLRVRSMVWTDLDARPRVPLAEGIGRTLAAVRSAHGQGTLS
ncbi:MULTISPECIES: NAD-dependent epimerase/dehydratase family protein [Microbacterium]|uniref:NAD-dependent epimerase/dehydratase family protein n=1 Tax=Microbacterium TaxID=33882 RepID=UPI000D64AEE2|nr:MULTISPECIES: NAD-dependent epimerase/dehydratase family protein [Microbacterium]